jgi:hypothetical protein
MRGSIRHRGEERGGSWEYIVDVGLAAAERCATRNKRLWIERRPRQSCPSCGGALTETEERRQSRVHHAEGVPGDDEQVARRRRAAQLHRPTKASIKEYLVKEWLPAVKATIRPSTYNAYVQHVECHIVPHIGSIKLQKLSGSQANALYATLAETGRKDGKSGLSAMTIHHVHACLHKACKTRCAGGSSHATRSIPLTRRARRVTARGR